jgi:peptidoglycan/LPS O-acetylase OafA/YrhL
MPNDPNQPTGPPDIAHVRTAVRRAAALMLFVAGTLAVASPVHLFGHVTGRGEMFDADHAGIAEALIGTVLLASAVAMLRQPRRARTIGLAATGFATVGFLWGLSITARAGHWPDIAYHLALLPVLIGCLVVLWRATDRPPPGTGATERRASTSA